MKLFKAKSVTGIMSQFQDTVDQLEALAASKDNESQYLADLVVKVEDLGDRFQMWVYNLHRKVVSKVDDLQMNLADKLHFKALDAEAESQAAKRLAEKLRGQFWLK